MDWERTKTVFILAFLLLNIIFASQLWLAPTFFDSTLYVSAEEVETKKTELRYKSIEVAAEVPRRVQPQRILTLSNPVLDWEMVARSMLGSGMISDLQPSNPQFLPRRFYSFKGEVVVGNDGILLYTSKRTASNETLTAEEALAKAEEFLQRTVGKPNDAVVGRIDKLQGGTWLVEYRQRWQRRDIETSWIWIRVDAQGVMEMEYYWADIVGFSGEKITTIPATGALTIIADSLLPGTTITQLHNSWYSKPVSAQQWHSYPVWVIEIGNGSKYYINAFTGDIEGNRNFRQENPDKS